VDAAATSAVVGLLLVVTAGLHWWLSRVGVDGVGDGAFVACVAYALYNGLSVLFNFILRIGGQSEGHGLSAAHIVVAALLLKLALSLGLFMHEVGGSLAVAWGEVVDGRGTLLRCALPGIAYVLSDALRTHCMLHMDLGTFTILYSLRTVGIAVLWVLVFATPLSWVKWVALGAMACGNVLQRSVHWHSGASSASKEAELFFMNLTLAAVALACVGGLANEVLLKTHRAPLNLQNAALYTWGLLALALCGHSQGVSWSPSEWAHLGPIGLAAVVVMAVQGIATSHLLKHLGNVWKEAAIALQIIISFAIEVEVFHTQFAMLAIVGVCTVFVGMSLFILDGMAKSKPQS
jgi:hypothetical protein